MVNEPGQARPGPLSQRHVDALVRDAADPEAVRIIRAAREPEQEGKAMKEAEQGAAPVELSAAEMESIRRGGEVPEEIADRIAATEVPEPASRAAEPPTAEPAAAPDIEPPGSRGS